MKTVIGSVDVMHLLAVGNYLAELDVCDTCYTETYFEYWFINNIILKWSLPQDKIGLWGSLTIKEMLHNNALRAQYTRICPLLCLGFTKAVRFLTLTSPDPKR